MKKDAYYFPHFANARNDNKILKLRRVLGMEGYGIYFSLLEVLREQTDFKIPLSSVEDLAYEWHVSKEKVESVVANFELFQIDESDFFSVKFNEYMQPYLSNKESRRIGGIKGNLIKSKYVSKEQADKMTNEEILVLDEKIYGKREVSERSIVAKRKVSETLPTPSTSQKKGKEKKRKENTIAHFDNAGTCFSFNEFWESYEKKKDRYKAEKIYNKLPEQDRQVIKDTIALYVQSTPEIKFRKFPCTYLNNRSWEDEIFIEQAAPKHNTPQPQPQQDWHYE